MATNKKVLELQEIIQPDSFARSLVEKFDNWDQQRQEWVAEQKELRNYIFATDTTKTTNSSLPWNNKTTLPKLTQIRDNLHANYISALFPNENWMKWEAFDEASSTKDKRDAIQAYMKNKVRLSGFRETINQLLHDYIDYGNCFFDVIWVNDTFENEEGEETINYIGPKLVRISPYDIVFNPLSATFEESPKIQRKLMSIGDLKASAEENPEDESWIREALNKIEDVRAHTNSFQADVWDKALGFEVDGFGSLQEYYGSGLVEILEFTGDFHNPATGEMERHMEVVVADRTHVVRKRKNPSWVGGGYKGHAAWRTRSDNLYGMGPLHNLVGMQYRIDHLENLKADVFDLIAFPPLKIIGEVEEFEWGPFSKIYIDADNSDVQMLSPDVTALNADTQIQRLEQQMEEYAGSPRETMGFRTPGEKTKFEVQTLITYAQRIFQEKISKFEVEVVEKALNRMLELARRNLNVADTVNVLDPDFGIEQFLTVTKDDIRARGKIRARGARHFNAQDMLIQNLVQLSSTPLWNEILPHLSGKNLAALMEETLGLERLDLFRENVNVIEKMETQRMVQQQQEQVAAESGLPPEQVVAAQEQRQQGGGQQ